MTFEMLIVFVILSIAVLLLVTEWFAMEVTALLALGAVALTGLVRPMEAISGFSNPAVITVWAVFILSSGLTHTGVANIIGRWVLKLSGRGEASLITVIMASAGVMSAFMNNVAVAALMLPVVRDISHQTGHAASRLLMPLAYGSLLGGLTTQIGTPPNLLVSDVLQKNGLESFGLFDFAPVGVIVMVAGIAFMVLLGRHLLPKRDMVHEDVRKRGNDLESQYNLHDRIFSLAIPPGASIIGSTLAQSRMGIILGLNVIAIVRKERTILSPSPQETLRAFDRLTVEGSLENMVQLKEELTHWGAMSIGKAEDPYRYLCSPEVRIAEVTLVASSSLLGSTLSSARFRNRFHVNVLALRREEKIYTSGLEEVALAGDDILLVQGGQKQLEELRQSPEFHRLQDCSDDRLEKVYNLKESLLSVRIPAASMLDHKSLMESRLGVALGIQVLTILKEDGTHRLPKPDDRLRAGDTLLIKGKMESLLLLKSLSEMTVSQTDSIDFKTVETEEIGLVEAILSPHSKISGKSLAQLHFREKYGLNVLSIWRDGKVFREAYLRDMKLRFGDAMLLYGPRGKFNLLGSEPDFLVLTEAAQAVPRMKKAKVSTLIMGLVLLPVVLGLVPIYIATLIGAACMVISGCLSMEEAHRSIEWKGIILIAGMLPLGTALETSGAAQFLTDAVVGLLGPWGPLSVMAGLMLLTFMATCVIPTAALVVLLGPIVLKTAADLDVSPHGMMMAVAVAASASFMTPISHPANIMVMGPGGYRFSDYLKVGIPLTITVLLVSMVMLPIVWPL